MKKDTQELEKKLIESSLAEFEDNLMDITQDLNKINVELLQEEIKNIEL